MNDSLFFANFRSPLCSNVPGSLQSVQIAEARPLPIECALNSTMERESTHIKGHGCANRAAALMKEAGWPGSPRSQAEEEAELQVGRTRVDVTDLQKRRLATFGKSRLGANSANFTICTAPYLYRAFMKSAMPA